MNSRGISRCIRIFVRAIEKFVEDRRMDPRQRQRVPDPTIRISISLNTAAACRL